MNKKQEFIKEHILRLDKNENPFICPLLVRKPTYKERNAFDKIKELDWGKEEMYLWAFCRRTHKLKIPFKSGDLTHICAIWGFSKKKLQSAYKKLAESGALNF